MLISKAIKKLFGRKTLKTDDKYVRYVVEEDTECDKKNECIEIGDLCPECSELLKLLKQNFKREVEKFKNEAKNHE